MTVWISAQNLDFSHHMENILKRIQKIGSDERADKFGHDRKVAFSLVFGELLHYLMNLERGPQNCGSISTVEEPNFTLPRIRSRYKSWKSSSAGRIEGSGYFSLRTLVTTECWSTHPYELKASSWSCSMTPVACVKDFAFCLGGPIVFMLRFGSWNYWVLSPVNDKSQVSLPGTICLKLKIQVGVCLSLDKKSFKVFSQYQSWRFCTTCKTKEGGFKIRNVGGQRFDVSQHTLVV